MNQVNQIVRCNMKRVRGRENQHALPSCFKFTIDNIASSGEKIYRSYLCKKYEVAAGVIDRWLKEIDVELDFGSTIRKHEDKINLNDFKLKVLSGLYTKEEICKTFGIHKNKLNTILRRQKIEPNFREYDNLPKPNDPKLAEYILTKGKQAAAREYGVTLARIISWCNKSNLEVPRYRGLIKKDIHDEIDSIAILYNNGHSVSSIAEYYNTSMPLIKRLLERSERVTRKTASEEWREARNRIRDNINLYIEENKNGLTAKEIAKRDNIGVGVLLDEFKKAGHDVIVFGYTISHGETEVKEYLESLGFNPIKLRRNFNGKLFEVDCFIENLNFGIEYCGEFWHSSENKPKKYHQDKFKWCLEQGITLMTIYEHEWYTKRELIESMIKSRLGLNSTKIYARKSQVLIIPGSTGVKFHNDNHVFGGIKSAALDIGLYCNGNLVSVMSVGKSRFSKEAEYEILRFSSLKNVTVVGGFSKMFSYFLKMKNPNSVLSYCDLRFGTGGVYLQANFVKVATATPPNYWYYYKSDGRYGKLESRIKYQKHKLVDLNNFSEDKTEYDIMSENGFLRLYDCGSYKYIWERGN
jgi:transposase